jgi:ABC-type multidrug transport system fused ATPase/permease subunit
MTTATGETPASYPVNLEVQRPDSQSRLTNFPLGIGTFIRLVLLVPHLIILYFLQIVASIIYFIATFAILFTGRYPRGMFNFYVGYTRWSSNVYGYLVSVYDNYPPFSMDQQSGYPLSFTVDYPESHSRLLNFPILGLIIKLILLIPHFIVVYFLILVALIVLFIAHFAILFTGSFPAGMHKFMIGVGRWSTRVNAYAYALTDKYPPFSLS